MDLTIEGVGSLLRGAQHGVRASLWLLKREELGLDGEGEWGSFAVSGGHDHRGQAAGEPQWRLGLLRHPIATFCVARLVELATRLRGEADPALWRGITISENGGGFVVLAVVATYLGEVIGFCRGKIADYKKPKRVVFMLTLDRMPSGKKEYKLIRERAREALGS